MALYLLDTNILVHCVRDDALGRYLKTEYALLTREPSPLISAVTEGELLSLVYQFGWREAKTDRALFLLDFFPPVPIDEPGMRHTYAVIDAYSESIGRSMGKNDVWIAAAAHFSNATLLTLDRDFDHLTPDFINLARIDPAGR
jgi:predicted nucleic acid-binding protein